MVERGKPLHFIFNCKSNTTITIFEHGEGGITITDCRPVPVKWSTTNMTSIEDERKCHKF